MGIILTVLFAIVFTEVVGYFLHRLLHSERVPWLSRSHMIHHLKDYGPLDPMRGDQYLSGARNRTAVVGIGLEWIIPSLLIYAVMIGGMTLLGLSIWKQAIAVGISMGWAYLMLNYFHDAMHIKDFWMLRIPLLSWWFRRARRRHDIHHKHLSNVGKMNKNFGICFFLMDRIFGTLEKKVRPFNNPGYGRALQRYDKIINSGKEE